MRSPHATRVAPTREAAEIGLRFGGLADVGDEVLAEGRVEVVLRSVAPVANGRGVVDVGGPRVDDGLARLVDGAWSEVSVDPAWHSGDAGYLAVGPDGSALLAVTFDDTARRDGAQEGLMALEGAEIICLPAEWPRPRQEHWRTLLRARAMENQLFVVATNCCGIQGKLDFFGMSLLLSARGEVLAEGGETDTELVGTFDYREMVDYRAQIRCYNDRRPEVYGKLE